MLRWRLASRRRRGCRGHQGAGSALVPGADRELQLEVLLGGTARVRQRVARERQPFCEPCLRASRRAAVLGEVDAAVLVDPVGRFVEVVERDGRGVDAVGFGRGAQHGREVRARDAREADFVDGAVQVRGAEGVAAKPDIRAGVDQGERTGRGRSDGRAVQQHARLPRRRVDHPGDMEPAPDRQRRGGRGAHHDAGAVGQREGERVTGAGGLQRQRPARRVRLAEARALLGERHRVRRRRRRREVGEHLDGEAHGGINREGDRVGDGDGARRRDLRRLAELPGHAPGRAGAHARVVMRGVQHRRREVVQMVQSDGVRVVVEPVRRRSYWKPTSR